MEDEHVVVPLDSLSFPDIIRPLPDYHLLHREPSLLARELLEDDRPHFQQSGQNLTRPLEPVSAGNDAEWQAEKMGGQDYNRVHWSLGDVIILGLHTLGLPCIETWI